MIVGSVSARENAEDEPHQGCELAHNGAHTSVEAIPHTPNAIARRAARRVGDKLRIASGIHRHRLGSAHDQVVLRLRMLPRRVRTLRACTSMD